MAQNQSDWHQLLRSILITGAIAVFPLPALAQRIPIADDTLGNERSIVTPINPTINAINGGARRGTNLFHSFREFHVDGGRGVYFTNPAGVANILTRVTGNSRSEILGILGVSGTANLFLLNPNGILFGPNAQLDFRGGSFVASTANSLLFNNGFAFSAANPQTPPLLTVNVPIGLQYSRNPGAIQVQGSFLQVPDGQTLSLAGGAVNIAGIQGELSPQRGLYARGGRVELTSVTAPGEVGLTHQGQEWQLTVPNGLARANVTISQDANLNVRSGGGGNIAITAGTLTVTGTETRVRAGIAAGLGAVGAQAGTIDINTTEAVNIDESIVANTVLPGGKGNAGNINITTRSFSLVNGAYLDTTVYVPGNGGNITITASNSVLFDGVGGSFNSGSGAYSWVNPGVVGQGGDINITTDNLTLTDGSQVSTLTLGQGQAGNVNIIARNAVSFDGVGRNGGASGTFSTVESGAIGKGGDINIATDNLSIANGAVINASTFGRGNAGDVTIAAQGQVFMDGVGRNGFSSGVFSIVGSSSAIGQSGDINITTDTLTVTNGGAVSAVTLGRGDAGNITITARDSVSFAGVGRNRFASGAFSTVNPGAVGQGGDINIATGRLSFSNGARVVASTYSKGDAGNINITAREAIAIDGMSSNQLASGVFSTVEERAIGQSGDIRITTSSLLITKGAVVNVGTFGQGDAGSISITASDQVSIDGVSSAGFSSGVSSILYPQAIGQGGNISITTGNLTLTNGGLVIASTFGQGDAGNITITASDRVSFDGVGSNGFSSGAYSGVSTGAIGKGGNITVQTELFSISNKATLSVSSEGEGKAGNIDVTTRQLRLDNQGSIQAQTASGQGGNITLQVQDYLLLRRGSTISTTAGTAQAGGDGGNIRFNGNFIVAVANENSDISANAFTGSGGRVEINAQGIFGIQFRSQLTPLSDITASSDFGAAGVVSINTPNVDPNRGLLQLPVDLNDASRLIVQNCPTGDTIAKPPNQFIITGRGGLPPTPSEAVNRDAIQVDLVTTSTEDQPSVSHQEPEPHQPSLSAATPIVEAQGWQLAEDGAILLVAGTPHNLTTDFLHRLIHCR